MFKLLWEQNKSSREGHTETSVAKWGTPHLILHQYAVCLTSIPSYASGTYIGSDRIYCNMDPVGESCMSV